MFLNKLLNRRKTLSVEEFCQSFYDSFVFLPTAEGRRVHRTLWDKVLDSLMSTEDSSIGPDHTLFGDELTAVQLEAFGLAWMHNFRLEKYAGSEEQYILPEIVFTKRYLEQYALQGIWAAMGAYNEAVGEAILHPRIEAADRVATPLISLEDQARFAAERRRFQKDLMVGAMEKWSQVIGSDCASHLLKRTSTRHDWGGRPIAIFLALALIKRLRWGIGLESEVFMGIEAVINRLYNDSKAAIESVILHV